MPKKLKGLPYFKFFVDAWLVSTRGMEPEVKGVYIDLLALCWNNQVVCGIPANHTKIAALIGVTTRTFEKIFAEISDKFVRTTFEGQDYYVNMRLLRSREECVDLQAVRAEAAGRRKAVEESTPDAMTKQLTSKSSSIGDILDVEEKRGDEIEENDDALSSSTIDTQILPAKTVHQRCRATWQKKKGLAAVCPRPLGKLVPWWQEVCESHPGDLIIQAFELWTNEEGFKHETESPLYDFLRSPYNKWLEKVDPTKKFTGSNFTEQERKDAMAAERERHRKQYGLDVPKDPQATMSVEDLLS